MGTVGAEGEGVDDLLETEAAAEWATSNRKNKNATRRTCKEAHFRLIKNAKVAREATTNASD